MPAPQPTQFIDVVDERNEPVGRVERAAALGERVNFRTVHVFVFDLSGQLLLQRLGADRAENGLRWGSSVAGYLHAGEGYLEAAVRRMQEEIAIIAPLAEVGVLGVPAEGGVQGVPADAGTKFVGLFTARSGDEPKIAEPGHIELLEFRPVPEVERDVQQDPSSYTDTFRRLLSFWQAKGRPGLSLTR